MNITPHHSFTLRLTLKTLTPLLSKFLIAYCYCKSNIHRDRTVFEPHKKVSFNIASEASYDSNLTDKKLIKSAKNCSFIAIFFENLKLAFEQCYQTKIDEKFIN